VCGLRGAYIYVGHRASRPFLKAGVGQGCAASSDSPGKVALLWLAPPTCHLNNACRKRWANQAAGARPLKARGQPSVHKSLASRHVLAQIPSRQTKSKRRSRANLLLFFSSCAHKEVSVILTRNPGFPVSSVPQCRIFADRRLVKAAKQTSQPAFERMKSIGWELPVCRTLQQQSLVSNVLTIGARLPN